MTPGSLLRTAARGASWVTVGTLVSTLGGLAATFVAARALSTEDFGSLVLATSVVAIAVIPARLGLDRMGLRLAGDARAAGGEAATQVVVARVLGVAAGSAALVGCVTGLLVVPVLGRWVFSSPDLVGVAPLVGLWAGCEGFRYVASEMQKSRRDYRMAVLVGNAARTTLFAGGLVVTVALVDEVSLADVVAVATGASCLTALAAVVALWWTHRRRSGPSGVVALPGASTIVATGLPMMVTTLAVFALGQGDLWVVGASAGPAEVGEYGAAVRLVVFLGLPLVIANGFLPPLIVDLTIGNEPRRLEAIMRATATVATVPAALVLFAFAGFGSAILEALYGPAFGGAAAVLVILATGQTINVAMGSCGLLLSLAGRQARVLAVVIPTSVVTIGAEIVAARASGVVAVAVVSALGVMVQNAILVVIARRAMGVKTYLVLSPREVCEGWRSLKRVRARGVGSMAPESS